MSHLPGFFTSPAQMQSAITTAVSGVPLGELPTQVHQDIAAAVLALPAGSTPAQVQTAITTALAGQPVGELPAQVHADIAAAVAALPVGATPAQVTAAITSATAGLATVAQVAAQFSGAPLAALADTTQLAVSSGSAIVGTIPVSAFRSYLMATSAPVPLPILALVMPTAVQSGTGYMINGTYANDGTSPILSVIVDGGSPQTLPAGSTVSGGSIVLAMGGMSNGTHRVQVQDGNGNLSNVVQFAVTPAETLTLDPITTPPAPGAAFSLTGGYANGTPGGLDYAITLTGDTVTWTSAVSPTLASGRYSIAVPALPAAGRYTVQVRDHSAQSIVASTALTVAAAAGTMPTVPLPVNAAAGAPAPANLPPLLAFTGPAGPPTGALALTHLGGAAIDTMVQNGSGALVLPGVAYAYAALEGLGALANGAFEIVAANGPQALNFGVFVRVPPDFSKSPVLLFKGGNGVQLYGFDPSNPSFSAPATFSDLLVSVTGQTVVVTVDGAQVLSFTGTQLPASGFVGLGSSTTPMPQAQVASVRVLTAAQIAAALAQSAATAAAAATAEALIGNPVTNPNADGFAPGIYGPDTVVVAAGSYGTRTYGNWFARLPTGGAQQWSLSGPAASTGMYLGGTSGTSLTEYGIGAANGTYPGVLTVTDGQSTFTKNISVVVQATAVIPGGCFILDSAAVNPYGNGSGDLAAQLILEPPIDQFAGGAATFTDPNGMLGWDRQGLNQLWVTSAGRPLSAHYGKHTGATFTSPAGTQAFTYYFAQEQPAGLTFQPVPAYTYAQPGNVFGRLLASSDAGIASYSVISTDTPLSIGSDGTMRYLVQPAAGAGNAVHVRVTSQSGHTTDITVSNPVQASTTLPASSMTLTLSAALDNSMGTLVAPGPVPVGTASVSGMGNPVWRVQAVGEFPLNTGSGIQGTFNIAPRAGNPALADITANFLSGQTYQVQVTATQGATQCQATTALTVADLNGTGPVIQIVPGSAVTATQAPTWNQAMDIYRQAPAANKGCTMQLPGGPFAIVNDPSGTADFNRHGIGHGNNEQYPPGPYTLRGPADVSNPAILTLNGAPGLSAQGGLIAQGGDVQFINLMVKNVSNLNAGEGNAGAFYKTGGCPHNLLIQDSKAYNSDNGFLSGYNEASTITMRRCVFAFNGIGAGGLTHNFYVGHAGHAIADQVLSFSTAQVHEGKWRSRITTITNSTFADGQNGVPGSSSCLDFPLGGLVNVTNTVLHKGPCPNGDTDMVQYGEEAPGQNGPAWDVNVLTLDGVTFLNTAAPGSTSSSTIAVNFMQGGAVPCVSPTTGTPATIVVKNSRFYNLPRDQWFLESAPGNTITDGGGNVFLTDWPGLQAIDPSTGVLLTQAHKPGPGFDAGYIGVKGDHGIVLDALELETRIPAGASVGSWVTQFFVYDQAGKPLGSPVWSLPTDQVNTGAFSLTASGQLNVAQAGLVDGLRWAKAQVTGTDSFGAAQSYTKYIYVIVGTGHVPGLATQGGAVLAA